MSTAVHSHLTLRSITQQNNHNNSTHRPLSKQSANNNNSNSDPRSAGSSTSSSNDSTLGPSTPSDSPMESDTREGASNSNIGVNNIKSKKQQRTNSTSLEVRPIINLKLQVIPPYNASNRKMIPIPARARRASAGAGDIQFVKESNSNKRRSEEPLDRDSRQEIHSHESQEKSQHIPASIQIPAILRPSTTTVKRQRTKTSPFDSLAHAASSALHSLPPATNFSKAPMSIDQAHQIASARNMRSQQITRDNHHDMKNRVSDAVNSSAYNTNYSPATTISYPNSPYPPFPIPVSGRGDPSNGLFNALDKIRADRRAGIKELSTGGDESSNDEGGLSNRRKGKNLTVSTSNSSYNSTMAPLRSAPVQTGLLGPSISRNGLATAYPTFESSSTSANGGVRPQFSLKSSAGPSIALANRPPPVSIMKKSSHTTIEPNTPNRQQFRPPPPPQHSTHEGSNSNSSHSVLSQHQSLQPQMIHREPTGTYHSNQQHQQQQSSNNDTKYSPTLPPPGTPRSSSSNHSWAPPPPTPTRSNYKDSKPSSSNTNNGSQHQQQQQQQSHQSQQSQQQQNYSNSKSTFLSLFSTFYDSLSDSRVLTNTLEDQIRRSSNLLNTLQDSGKVFENMLEDRVRGVVRDFNLNLLGIEKRLDNLEKVVIGSSYSQYKAKGKEILGEDGEVKNEMESFSSSGLKARLEVLERRLRDTGAGGMKDEDMEEES